MYFIFWLMKFFYCFSLIVFIFYSCQGESNSCINTSIETFNQFMGFHAGSTEKDIYTNLGIASEKHYSTDSTKLIYGYLYKRDVPIAVVVNSHSKFVESVMMEVLTFGDEFTSDLNEAKDFYKLDSCETRFFGMTENQIKSGFDGDPERKTENGGIILLNYCSSDYKTCITFKLYPEQGNICSTIILSWNH
ncbi:MAG: hypothetical protein IPM77_00270 [Crocinitomicaceae bacterium]|nr:hypothetical protein [Crocinitomicaceae bacterium]